MESIYSASKRILPVVIIGAFALAAAMMTGCKKNDNNPVNNSATVSPADEAADAADAVSDALAGNNGGAMDQVNDVFEIAGGVGVGGGVLGKTLSDSLMVGKTYDTTSMSWIIDVYKQINTTSQPYYGVWTRDYLVQFRANGEPQKYRKTNGILADTIIHRLTGGTGHFWTPRLVHYLDSIGSSWIASNTNTDSVTINGSYARTGTDTIKALGVRHGRVLNDVITMTFVNVTGPSGVRFARSEKTSGKIIITFTATATLDGKELYTISKTFDVFLGGGYATFSINGSTFVSDLGTGDH